MFTTPASDFSLAWYVMFQVPQHSTNRRPPPKSKGAEHRASSHVFNPVAFGGWKYQPSVTVVSVYKIGPTHPVSSMYRHFMFALCGTAGSLTP